MGWCEMVGDYNDDSSVKENLNLLLCLTRVEANVDSLDEGLLGFLEGHLRRTRYKGDLRGLDRKSVV